MRLRCAAIALNYEPIVNKRAAESNGWTSGGELS